MLCLPKGLADPEELKKMLFEANNEIVPEQDVLSYNIYLYDSGEKRLSAYVSDYGHLQ